MPGDLGNATLDAFGGVLKEHESLSAEILNLMFALFIHEVLFEEIDLIVLVDAFLD